MEESKEIPNGVKPDGEGARLWLWMISEATDESLASTKPMAVELCVIADRLSDVRSKIAAQGLTVSGAKGRSAKNPLLDIEIKLSGQFSKIWKTLGFDRTNSEEKQPVGRPSGGIFNSKR